MRIICLGVMLSYSVASATSKKLHRQVDELECHLFAAETLENNGLPQTIAFIRDTQVTAGSYIHLQSGLTTGIEK